MPDERRMTVMVLPVPRCVPCGARHSLKRRESGLRPPRHRRARRLHPLLHEQNQSSPRDHPRRSEAVCHQAGISTERLIIPSVTKRNGKIGRGDLVLKNVGLGNHRHLVCDVNLNHDFGGNHMADVSRNGELLDLLRSVTDVLRGGPDLLRASPSPTLCSAPPPAPASSSAHSSSGSCAISGPCRLGRDGWKDSLEDQADTSTGDAQWDVCGLWGRRLCRLLPWLCMMLWMLSALDNKLRVLSSAATNACGLCKSFLFCFDRAARPL